MARITSILSNKVDARGKSQILLRFVGARSATFRLKSRIYIRRDRFKDGAVIIPRIAGPEQAELRKVRNTLDALAAFLLDEYAAADRDRVTKDWMQEAVERFHHPERSAGGASRIAPLFRDFIEAKEVSPSRRARYEVILRSLDRFEQAQGRPLTVDGLTVRGLDAFRRFLEKDGTRGKNVVIQYLDILRTFYRWLGLRGITSHNPFNQYKIGTAVYGTPYYLTIEERDRIARTNLRRHPSLAVQRDIFVFQCLVGCRVGDLVRFRKADVSDGFLSYIPRKTRDGHPVVVRVPLNDQAAAIVERYAGGRSQKLLPFISTQKYNDAIKTICKAARIRRIVTVLDPLTRQELKRPLYEVASSHLARRTFVGNLYRQIKDPALIGSMTGHVEGSKAFARYRDIDDQIKTEIVKLLESGSEHPAPAGQKPVGGDAILPDQD